MRAPRSSVWIAALALAAVALSVVTFLPRSAAQPREIRTELSLADALGTGDTAGYSRAIEPRPFIFPDDHGDHPDFATEWWYLTGNLDASDGRRFGYQLTFFRSALASESADRRSAWATRQAWMAHFAVTDVRANRFHGAERFAREAQQLAGAASSPFRVWLEDWSIEGNAGDGFSVRARASTDSIAIDLAIEQGKPIVLQGDRGLSLKGPEPGNASYYYSMTRMPTTGTVTSAGVPYSVSGSSWLDREWSTSALREGVVGWDWFALQFDDSTELMLYRLRRSDGSSDPFSAGTFISASGLSTPLAAGDFTIDETAFWLSTIDGTRYPSAWTLHVRRLDLTVDVEPLVANQELDLAVRYWEGAARADATRNGIDLRGRGYVELTGYAGPPSTRTAPNNR